jgi:hypothetical protein
MKSKVSRIFIFAEQAKQDTFFSAVVRDGIAYYKGNAYVVRLARDGKRYYGCNHGPEVTQEATKQAMEDYLLGR